MKHGYALIRALVACVGILSISGVSPAAADEDVVLADFEAATFGKWETTGTAFGDGPVEAQKFDIQGFRGARFVNSFHNGDPETGTLTSPPFEIARDHIAFLIAGGNHPGKTGIELLLDGKAVRSATGNDSGVFEWQTWDVRELHGKTARLRIIDRAEGAWGHTNVDHVLLTDNPRSGAGTWRLEDYRKAESYYRERYRPQFHFSPELNWMNDPNGLVFFQGEYHLFYQHNPHGNTWGHMSWGHAVSKDLVRWEHLPIALHEEYGVMIFSGCVVVDWHNTSGFGKDGQPPLVAIYTGHGHGKQTQDLAYSTDRGRTWTKYRGNPVIDLDKKDFRDPKVFWHGPTGHWVMVVSLAAEKKVQFYRSRDLKTWAHLSDFGPAGARGVSNWECPDLFPLPVEGSKGKQRWVLEADVGDGAVAGGSGGQYFIGDFDGTRFRCDHPPDEVRWVDHGRDFYAPVSWSDVPEADGRRIWIGWMNNWQTNRLPTHPWRSAMSIPRALSLRQTDGGPVLVQTPVRELERLRGKHVQRKGLVLAGGDEGPRKLDVKGDTLEIVAEIEVGKAAEVGLLVRKGKDEQTVIGYDTAKGELFVDRTRSGKVDFHPAFAGRHAAPLKLADGRLHLHVFVDVSSVEVFGDHGRVVITDRIFPDPASQAVALYARGGEARVKNLDVWQLRSLWHGKR